jgi:hypothetical protein
MLVILLAQIRNALKQVHGITIAHDMNSLSLSLSLSNLLLSFFETDMPFID